MKDHTRILVTGGAGFIGSALVESLLEKGHRVTVLDNFSTGRRENLLPFADNPGFTLIEGDIRDLETCRAACAGQKFILHEAALGSVPRSVNDPLTSFAVNISGFANMMIAARDAGVKRFVYASSSSVYGSDDSPVKQEARTGVPLSPYALTKHTDELIAANFASLYGMETIGLRYFNVFGRRQDPNGAYAAVIPKFMLSLMHHESPVINGDGSFSRDFTYVDNVVSANLLALDAPAEALDRCYNIACGARTTLNELFVLLRGFLAELDPAAAEIQVIHGPPRVGDIPHSLADVSLAGKYLGYRPQWQVREGLREAVKWYFRNLK
ncbi:MAG: SDR family oxidoreductase [Lentisphaeria bacterium]|nr:SDR family oxidoreductase [Lentisphaeria bacterium]